MDAFEINKIVGAVLFVVLILAGTRTVSNLLFAAHAPEKPGYEVDVTDSGDDGDKTGGGEEKVSLAMLLSKGSAEKGKKVAKKCTQCHSAEKGGKKPTGPSLYGVLGRAKGQGEDFAYSSAMKEKGGNWTYEDLDGFIAAPKKWLRGTKMSFAGIKKADQRANLILYLRSLSESPLPLPDVAASAATGDAAAKKAQTAQ